MREIVTRVAAGIGSVLIAVVIMPVVPIAIILIALYEVGDGFLAERGTCETCSLSYRIDQGFCQWCGSVQRKRKS